MPGRRYKDYRFYAFIALHYIFQTLDIYLDQNDLLDKAASLMDDQPGVTKTEIMHEIKSNHNMTNKVLDYLEKEGLAYRENLGKSYRIKITLEGVKYLQQYSRFYRSIFSAEIEDHYRYGRRPPWAR